MFGHHSDQQQFFFTRCSTCHTIGGGDEVGPLRPRQIDLRGLPVTNIAVRGIGDDPDDLVLVVSKREAGTNRILDDVEPR